MIVTRLFSSLCNCIFVDSCLFKHQLILRTTHLRAIIRIIQIFTLSRYAARKLSPMCPVPGSRIIQGALTVAATTITRANDSAGATEAAKLLPATSP